MIRFIAVTLLFTCVPAYATSVSVLVVGEFSSYSDPGRLLPFPEPAPGTVITLTFTYDSDTPDEAVTDPQIGFYPGAISTMSLTIGDYLIPSWPDRNIVMINNSEPSPQVDLWAADSRKDTTPQSDSIGFSLIDSRGTALITDALCRNGHLSEPDYGQSSTPVNTHQALSSRWASNDCMSRRPSAIT